eukprot:360838-Chlamydomonas_euryale.AAC.1
MHRPPSCLDNPPPPPAVRQLANQSPQRDSQPSNPGLRGGSARPTEDSGPNQGALERENRGASIQCFHYHQLGVRGAVYRPEQPQATRCTR